MKQFLSNKLHAPARALCLLAASVIGFAPALVAAKKTAAVAQAAQLTPAGNALRAKYDEQFKGLQAEIAKSLPAVPEQKKSALKNAQQATAAAQKTADGTSASAGKSGGIKAKIDNWKKFWIGRAQKSLDKAQADLAAATTDAAREAAKKEIAKWQANKADGEAKIKEAQAELAQAQAGEQVLVKANQAAQAALAKARSDELNAAKAILADVEAFVGSDKLDAKLVKCAVLAGATPQGLAEFAQQGPEQEALVDQLLADPDLMKRMLEAGGANYGKFGQAMQIQAAIAKASPQARDGALQRLALGISLECAVPIKQSHAAAQQNAPATVDPVKRYLHYEKAFLAGELDPAFKNLTAWEYRMVVDCDEPDEMLAWGREMLRNYRPDHTTNPNYGWRYSAAVKTEVPYGSQNVKNDLPSLYSCQNIVKDGGVCGRRAFFGRFILRSFGIPVWGVTQHAHAALSHWTPKGWVVNLGAGFEHSWWDKGDVSLGGADFLLETQARENTRDYFKVLRAQWVSRILGEEAYNGRKKIAGGFWSSTAHYQAKVLAAHAAELGPLGKELAEANEPEEKQTADQQPAQAADQRAVAGPDGTITIPAVANKSTAGRGSVLKSYSGGFQLNAGGGYKADYAFEAPRAGKYALAIRVVTVQEGQKFLLSANDGKAPVTIPVPYTIGKWQQTKPVEILLAGGNNTLHFAIEDGSRGVSIKDFTLTPVK